jgi:hypothetical protein
MLEEVGQPVPGGDPAVRDHDEVAGVPGDQSHGARCRRSATGAWWSPRARRSASTSPTPFPEAGLAPAPADPLRGTYYRWIFFAAGPVEQVVLGKALGLLAPEEKKGNVGYGTYDDT